MQPLVVYFRKNLSVLLDVRFEEIKNGIVKQAFTLD
jgi:hypothetical protein